MCSRVNWADSRLFDFSTMQSVYSDMGAHRKGACVVFKVYAPRADRVFLVGSFNCWKESHPMYQISDDGVWEIEMPASDVPDGAAYKYLVIEDGQRTYKTDPYSVKIGNAPYFDSVYCDGRCLESESKNGNSHLGHICPESPLNIYSFSCKQFEGCVRNYSEMAQELAVYVRQMCYTHVCISDVFEMFTDNFSSEELIAYYSARSDFGGIREFFSFVNIMHSHGIGVIIDWRVRAKDLLLDCMGIPYFVSNAEFWLDALSVDGLIMSVDEYTDGDVLGRIAIAIKKQYPNKWLCADTLTEIADDEIFDARIDRGWIQRDDGFDGIDPKAVLVMSNSGPLCEGYETARLKMLLAQMMTYSGKKMTRAGFEMGVICSDNVSIVDFDNIDESFQLYCSDIGAVYLENESLWNSELVDLKITERNVMAYSRKTPNNEIVVLINPSPETLKIVEISVDTGTRWSEIFNSDSGRYGGTGFTNENGIRHLCNDGAGISSIMVKVSPFGVSLLRRKI